MDSAIKKRLVGALVVSLLLLLTLPVIFSGQGRLPEARITDIPDAPMVSSAPAVESPRSSEGRTQSVDEILSPRPITQPEAAPEPPAESEADSDTAGTDSSSRVPAVGHDASGQIEAWSVQMGSFRQADNARGLLNRLREAGYQAYTKETPLSDGNTLTQVMVGPDTDFAAVQQLKDTLAEEFDLSTLVVRFQP